jgi:hypothetical protein
VEQLPGDFLRYEIRIRGCLDPSWFDWFDGLAVTHLASGDSVLTGVIPDQAALHGVMARIRDLNLQLLSLRVEG